jgi:predicted enzyme related to lactoylglutathione lyase
LEEVDVSGTGHTHLTEVRTITVPVSDQQRALEFYTDKLGLETRLDLSYGNGQRWIEVAVPEATTTISLAPPGQGKSCGVDTGIRFRTSDAQADFEGFKARGVPVVGEVMQWPGTPPMFTFTDLDGNVLYVVEEMAQAAPSVGALKRFAVLVKSSEEVESGAMPAEQDLAAMSRFNDQLVESGAMLAGEGFHASADGARLTYADGDVRIQRGPFPDPGSLVAGYWIIQAASLDEVVGLMSRAPLDGGSVEIRQIFDAEEFGDAFTPELREREERQRTAMERNARRRAA